MAIRDVIIEIVNPLTDERIMASGLDVTVGTEPLVLELTTTQSVEVTLGLDDIVVDMGVDTQTIVLEITKEEEVSQFTLLIDEVSPTPSGTDAVTYIGEALPGTATSASSWRIKRVTEYSIAGADADIEWADGTAAFDKIWDDRATYTYS